MRARWLRPFREPFFVIGVTLLAVGTGLGLATVSRLSRCRRAPGVVTEFVPVDPDSPRLRRPLVRYEAEGRPFGFAFGTASDHPTPGVGTRVDVLFLPEDPTRAWVDDSQELYAGPILVAGAGLLLTFVWAVSRRFHRGRR